MLLLSDHLPSGFLRQAINLRRHTNRYRITPNPSTDSIKEYTSNMFPLPGRNAGCNFPSLYSTIMNTSERVQMAKDKRDIKQEIVSLSQLHVINVA
jgi:hypothetical protein